MTFRDRLKRLHDAHRRGKSGDGTPEGVYDASDTVDQEPATEDSPPPPVATATSGWAGLGATRDNSFGAPVWIASECCGEDQTHGHWSIRGCRRADHSAIVEYIDGFDRRPRARELLYLDIETTGLGEGAFAFMIGVAFWDGDLLQVEHLLIDDPDHEPALLKMLASRYDERPVVITYNGSRFDIPLLQRRYKHHDLDDPFGKRPHLDLLPFCRDTFAGLPRYKLATLEEHILEFVRVDDVPGAQIPKRWWRFKKNKNSELMRGVLEHNRHDVVSMAALVAEATLGTPDAPIVDDEKDAVWSKLWSRSSSKKEPRDNDSSSVADRLERSYRLREKFSQSSQSGAESAPSPASTGPQPEGYATLPSSPTEPSVQAYCSALREQAQTLVTTGLYHQAIPLLAEALALDPAHAPTRQALAEVYRQLGKDPLADALNG